MATSVFSSLTSMLDSRSVEDIASRLGESGSAVWTRSIAVTARSPHSAIRTAMAGCSRS